MIRFSLPSVVLFLPLLGALFLLFVRGDERIVSKNSRHVALLITTGRSGKISVADGIRSRADRLAGRHRRAEHDFCFADFFFDRFGGLRYQAPCSVLRPRVFFSGFNGGKLYADRGLFAKYVSVFRFLGIRGLAVVPDDGRLGNGKTYFYGL